ncbi:MAG: hypothetical protein U0575_08725 [Phycisphaerales bacterium]
MFAVPGGATLLVPDEYPTIEAAAAAIVLPQFQSIVLAPGSYELSSAGMLDVHGATIRGATGNPRDVMVNGSDQWINNGLLDDLSISHSALMGVVGTNCMLDQCGGALVPSSFFGCTMNQCGFCDVTCDTCTITSQVGCWPFATCSLTLRDSYVNLAGTPLTPTSIHATRTTFEATPITAQVFDIGGQGNFVQCLFKGASGEALRGELVANVLIVVNCTFVGNQTDILLENVECGTAAIFNTIGSIVWATHPCSPTQLVALYDLAGEGLVNADGTLPPGSPAVGAANPYVAIAYGVECGLNIGWDQGRTSDPCDFVAGDVNSDGIVNGADLGVLLGYWPD